MEEFDFSIEGITRMQLDNPDKINDWLMYDTGKVKDSVLGNLKKNPKEGKKLIQHFSFLVRKHVFITDKRFFLDIWERGCASEIFSVVRYKTDNSLTAEQMAIHESLIEELNSCVWKICNKAEEELFEAYQDQRIDPVNRHIAI